jgi:hypothetical protein
VFEFGFAFCDAQCIETSQLAVFLGNVDVIVTNEIGRDGEIRFPVFDPVFGIAPVTLCVERNLRQRVCLVG